MAGRVADPFIAFISPCQLDHATKRTLKGN